MPKFCCICVLNEEELREVLVKSFVSSGIFSKFLVNFWGAEVQPSIPQVLSRSEICSATSATLPMSYFSGQSFRPFRACKASRYLHGYESIPINTIFRGMNIHLPAILMFTRGTRFWHTATSLMPLLEVQRLRNEPIGASEAKDSLWSPISQILKCLDKSLGYFVSY